MIFFLDRMKLFYEVWQKEVKKVGFSLSLGKNYIHSSILTVNSEIYHFNCETLEFSLRGYLNVGLLTGQSKITGRKDAQDMPIWDLYNYVIPTSVRPLRTDKRFLHYYKEQIEKLSNKGTYNLHLPHRRGGLGMIVPNGLDFYITSFQRRWATYLENSYNRLLEDGVLPSGQEVGLVSAGRPPNRPIMVYHKPLLILEPIIGPHSRGAVEFEERVVEYPILAKPFFEGELASGGVIARLPRRKFLRAFREEKPSRMGTKRILFYDSLVMEIPRLTTEVSLAPKVRVIRPSSLGRKFSEFM